MRTGGQSLSGGSTQSSPKSLFNSDLDSCCTALGSLKSSWPLDFKLRRSAFGHMIENVD